MEVGVTVDRDVRSQVGTCSGAVGTRRDKTRGLDECKRSCRDCSSAPFELRCGTTYGNLAQRLGIAWKPSKTDNFVVRGGAGVFYDLGAGAADAATYFPGQTSLLTYGVSLPVTNISSYLPAVSRAALFRCERLRAQPQTASLL